MVHAVQLRDEFAAWLAESLSVDAEKTSDIVLAVNESLANAAEHAYLDCPEPGRMHIRAEYDPRLAALTVWITDEGRWRTKEPSTAPNPARGRGLMLMRALTDSAAVDSTDTGTEVRLHWDQIAVRPAEPEQDDERLLA